VERLLLVALGGAIGTIARYLTSLAAGRNSTFSYETVRLMEANAWSQAWINVVVTTTICLCLCFLGIGAGRLVLSMRG
jgi:fluoride ion exporter CrcB/FEX